MPSATQDLLFAIKDAVKVTLHPQGESETTNDIVIGYLNSCNLKLEGETLYAKMNGNDFISMGGARKGTFQMDAEVIKDDYLALMLGGTLDKSTGKITATGQAPATAYELTGVFNVTTSGKGNKAKDLKLFNVKPQLGTDLTLSASEVANFTLVLDVMVDATEAQKLLELTDHSAL